MTLADVVKTTVFLADMNDFAEMNKVYGEYFASPFPARAVQMAKLPKGAPLEIECIAVSNRASYKETVQHYGTEHVHSHLNSEMELATGCPARRWR